MVPTENAMGIAPDANVTAFFFEPVRAGTVNVSTVKPYKVGPTTAFSATVARDAAPQKTTLNPSANLPPGAKY